MRNWLASCQWSASDSDSFPAGSNLEVDQLWILSRDGWSHLSRSYPCGIHTLHGRVSTWTRASCRASRRPDRRTETSKWDALLSVINCFRYLGERRGEQNALEVLSDAGEEFVDVRPLEHVNLMLDSINFDGNHKVWILHWLKIREVWLRETVGGKSDTSAHSVQYFGFSLMTWAHLERRMHECLIQVDNQTLFVGILWQQWRQKWLLVDRTLKDGCSKWNGWIL